MNKKKEVIKFQPTHIQLHYVEYDRKEAYLIYQDSLMKVAEKDGFAEGIKRQKRRENCRTNLNGKINEKENIYIELIKK